MCILAYSLINNSFLQPSLQGSGEPDIYVSGNITKESFFLLDNFHSLYLKNESKSIVISRSWFNDANSLDLTREQFSSLIKGSCGLTVTMVVDNKKKGMIPVIDSINFINSEMVELMLNDSFQYLAKYRVFDTTLGSFTVQLNKTAHKVVKRNPTKETAIGQQLLLIA